MDKKKIASYLLIKLSAICFLTFSFLSFAFIQDEFNLYRLSELLSGLPYSPWFYVLLCYALLCSFIIDKLSLEHPSVAKKVFLYIICGYLFFLPFHLFSDVSFSIFFIAGTVGAICAVFFYYYTYIAQKKKWFRYSTPILISILWITIASTDFTEKEQWVEHTTKNEFEATFSYFNGEHKILIHLTKGETLEFTLSFPITGGYGFHVSSEFNKIESMSEINEDTNQLSVMQTGTYYIVVTGDKLKGTIKANWKIY
ncbi:hypothetical protein [Bacillus sp. C1]